MLETVDAYSSNKCDSIIVMEGTNDVDVNRCCSPDSSLVWRLHLVTHAAGMSSWLVILPDK